MTVTRGAEQCTASPPAPSRRWWILGQFGIFGYLMPPLMAVAVVVTANHYVLDVVAGVAFVLVGHAAALALERRRAVQDSG